MPPSSFSFAVCAAAAPIVAKEDDEDEDEDDDADADREASRSRFIRCLLYVYRYIFLRKYAESMQKVCSAKTLLCLTLSAYSVLQQLSLFQTKPKPLDPILQSVPKP